MKEMIAIEKEVLCRLLDWVSMQMVVYKDEDLKKERKIVLFGKEYQEEQIPETFEELKILCKGIKGVDYAGGNAKGEIIEISNTWFAENGEIWGYTDDFTGICNISKNRTPQQMWQIIKNLVGE